MNVKAIAVMVIVVALASGALVSQSCTPQAGVTTVKLTAQDMERLINEFIPPEMQQQMAANPEERKKLVTDLKELFSVAQAAERENYLCRPDVQSQVAIQQDEAIQNVYVKRNPGATASDDEVNTYYVTNPDAFDKFLAANPKLAERLQPAQRDGIKKQFGQLKVLAARARKEGLENDETVKLLLLLARSQVLAGRYREDLDKNLDQQLTDEEVKKYYEAHADEFEEIRARHVLVSTNPVSHAEDDGHGHSAEEVKNQPTPLSKEEARKKAEALLERARQGEDFAKLATEHSDEPSARQSGGDLGFFSKGAMVPAFYEAANALKPGELSPVVETQFGFHVIKLEERRTMPMDNEANKERIKNKLKADRRKQKIDEIVAAGKVEVAEDFKLAAAPAPAAPAEAQKP